MPQNEVRLTLQSRPLRLAYIINSKSDLMNAIKLYTHLWGGLFNSIFTVPKNESQLNQLHLAIFQTNPDYILLSEGEVPPSLSEMLQQLPIGYLQLPAQLIDDISNITSHLSYLPIRSLSSFSRRDFPHSALALRNFYKHAGEAENFQMIVPSQEWSDISCIQFGLPAKRYAEFLINDFNTGMLNINNDDSFIKASLIASVGRIKTPLSLTRLDIQRCRYDFASQNYPSVLNLFLYENNDLSVASTFWNSRRLDTSYSNKFIFRKDKFTRELRKYILAFLDFSPSISEIRVYTRSTKKSSRELAEEIFTLCKEFGRNVWVRVFFKGFSFDICSGQVYFQKSTNFTRTVRTIDQSIQFTPSPPVLYEDSECIFGYDARVEFADGRSLSTPFTQSSAILLSNKLAEINGLKNNDFEKKTQPIRSNYEGVTGITTPNEECHIYLPDAEKLIAQWLKNLNLTFRPNEHTRYAKGFIKRFGGLNKVKSLVSAGGTKIFTALTSNRSEQSGLTYDEMLGFFSRNFKIDNKSSQQLLNQNLPTLLKACLVYRGYALECSQCGLKHWYKIDKISEMVECVGCAEYFQLENLSKIPFSYKPNELAARFLGGDGQSILSTITFLSYLAANGHIELGGDLIYPGKNSPFAEIDLLILVENILVLVECKTSRLLDDDKLDEILRHLHKVVEVAEQVNSLVVVLGVATTEDNYDNLSNRVSEVAQISAKKGIGVHLLVNDKFYRFGKRDDEITESWTLSVASLLAPTEIYIPIGEVTSGVEMKSYQMGQSLSLNQENFKKCLEILGNNKG